MMQDVFTQFLQTSITEWLAFAGSVLYVWLAARSSNWCWLFAFVSSALYVYLCFVSKLYADSLLQCFYVVMAVVGWVSWNQPTGADKQISRRKTRFHLYFIAIASLSSLLLGFGLYQQTGQWISVLDAVIFSFSIGATILMTRRILENWIYFIVADLLAIPLFWSKNYLITAVLYLIYTLLAIHGYRQWQKQFQALQA